MSGDRQETGRPTVTSGGAERGGSAGSANLTSDYRATGPESQGLDARDFALRYAAKGWPVLPLYEPIGDRCSCGRLDCGSAGKHPRTPHGLQDASTDAATIRNWWQRWPAANIGIACGPAGLVVLDVDPRHNGDDSLAEIIAQHGAFPETPRSLTGGGGQHILFANPNGHRLPSKPIGIGLDVKSDGGYIVAPPSLHPSGRRYCWELSCLPSTTPLAPAPAWLLQAVGDTDKPKIAAPISERIPAGQRNAELLSLAGSMRRRAAKEDEILAALRVANANRCEPPLTDGEVAAIAASVARYAPAVAAPVATVPRVTGTPTGCPELPTWARLDPAIGQGAGAWVDSYLAAARCVSPMTPAFFHESLALWLAAVAVARRLVLRLSHGDLFCNLFVAWLAQTTLWRKSTALDFGRGIARHTFPHLMAPQDCTPEAFLSDLAGMEPTNLEKMPDDIRAMWRSERNFAGQRGFALDELSGILATAGRDYGAGLIEAFLHFYDCDPLFVRSSRGQGRVAVRDSCLSVLGASTPAAMAEHLGVDRLWSMGWWPRFALLTPETERPEWQEATGCSIEARDALAAPLRRLYERLPEPTWPEPPEAVNVTLGPGVFEAWAKYNRACGHELLTPDLDGRLWGTYGRLPTQALKVSMLLAALDWGTTPGPCIELRHLARAMQIAETWRASAHRVIEAATSTEWGRFRLRILRQLAKAGQDGATLRDVYRQMQDMRPADIEETLQQMVTAEEVEVMRTPAGKRGQPTKRYRLVRE